MRIKSNKKIKKENHLQNNHHKDLDNQDSLGSVVLASTIRETG